MQKFVLRLMISAFLLFASAVADNHDSCTCHNSDSYNWRITTKACDNYGSQNYSGGSVYYNSTTGRCTQTSSNDYLMGDQWQDACQAIAQSGYQCPNNQGTCYASTSDVKGWC